MAVALAILPLALLIALGYGLAKSGLIPRDQWGPIETLSFRALIPAVLILAIARSDLSPSLFGGFVAALLLCLLIIGVAVLITRVIAPGWLANPQLTSVFQLSVRWNAFVALAAAEQLVGPGGLAVIAVGIAILIPTINITCILVLAAFGPQSATVGQILRTVAKNPLVQACAVGLALNMSGVVLPDPLIQTLDLVGRGALAVGLLAIGAAISLRRLAAVNGALALSVLMRPLLAPLVFLMLARAFDLPPVQIMAGILIFAAPAASNGFIIAKQMGGDAPLYADALTWQTLICLLVLPVWAWVLA